MMRPGLTRQTQSSGVPLPEPMRTSSGFFETGTSGNTRIHTRPERFICRVKRAARRLDLTRGNAFRLQRLEPKLAEGKRRRAGRNTVDAAFVRLTEFGSHRLQHGERLSLK